MFYSYQTASRPPYRGSLPVLLQERVSSGTSSDSREGKVVVLQHPRRGGAMEPARKLDQSHSWNSRSYPECEPDYVQAAVRFRSGRLNSEG